MTEAEIIAELRERAHNVRDSMRIVIIHMFYGYRDEHGQNWITGDGIKRLAEVNIQNRKGWEHV